MKMAVFAVVIICMVLYSCDQSKKNTPLDANLKAAFNYQKGTYWIYKDSISGNEDSFFVTDNIPTTFSSSGSIFLDGIQILISEYSISDGTANTIFSWQFLYESNRFGLKQENSKNDYQIILSPLINYPFSDSFRYCAGCDIVNTDTNQQLLNVYDLYTVKGNSYNNVAEVYHSGIPIGVMPASNTFYNDWYYVSPGVGIIKMRLNHPLDSLYRVWEIERWNIVR